MQDHSLCLGKANLLQKICEKGPQRSEIFGQKISMNLSFRQIRTSQLVKILEGTLIQTYVRVAAFFELSD